MNTPLVINKEIDVKGLSCPLPILKTKKGLSEIESGQTLKVVATDMATLKDFPTFAKQTGHSIVSISEDNGLITFVFRKK